MIDGVALGDAGFERLDVELRLHTHTHARFKLAQKDAQNFERLYISEKELSKWYREELTSVAGLYEVQKRKVGKKNKVIKWLTLLAIFEGIVIGVAVQ